MKHIYIILLALCFTACREKTPEEEAQMTLKEALEALNKDDHEAYLKYVDMGEEMDPAKTAYMKDVLRQHLGWRRSERAAVVAIDMIDAQMESDSICTVYYQYTFSDGTNEVGAQKMVRYGEAWKIRLRN
ncbi:MAG: hypothetical protein IKN44_07380 [Bacteroidaceae bacterium]|nr:hypothetical protein [Bacteroidaceae bacterium]